MTRIAAWTADSWCRCPICQLVCNCRNSWAQPLNMSTYHDFSKLPEGEIKYGVSGQPLIDTERQRAYYKHLNERSSLPGALLGGMIGMIASALLWAAIAVGTGYNFSFVSIAVGFVVGVAVRLAGRGLTPPFAIIGAVFSFLGIVVGNVLTIAWLEADLVPDASVLDVLLSASPFEWFQYAIVDTFMVLDFAFYAVALYMGASVSRWSPDSEEEKMQTAQRYTTAESLERKRVRKEEHNARQQTRQL